jgi:hypothetical protein
MDKNSSKQIQAADYLVSIFQAIARFQREVATAQRRLATVICN